MDRVATDEPLLVSADHGRWVKKVVSDPLAAVEQSEGTAPLF